MDCQLIEPSLVDFHFGTCHPEQRQATETHLLSCAGCLRAFLELKRNLESPGDLRPSAVFRERLRRDVEDAVAPLAPRLSSRRFLRAPAIATAVTTAAFTAAAALLFMLHPHPRPSSVELWKTVDSASPVAASLSFF